MSLKRRYGVMKVIEYGELSAQLEAFASKREWGQFHTPKNLAMALAGETGELMALLQWMSDDQIENGLSEEEFRSELSDELADVLMYLVRLADVAGIDLAQATQRKIEANEDRYDPKVFRGSSSKAPH